jgi:excisionase family DNA binding protein
VENLLTTKLAAERLGVTARRVRALITKNRLPATKLGSEWLINEADLALVADRKTGRAPRKPRTPETTEQHEEGQLDPNN